MITANLNLENAQTWGNLELTLQVGLSEVPYLYGRAYLGEAVNTIGVTGKLKFIYSEKAKTAYLEEAVNTTGVTGELLSDGFTNFL